MRRESMRPGTDKKLTREFTRPANIVAPVVMVSNKLRRAVRRGGDSRINPISIPSNANSPLALKCNAMEFKA
jgi:hypothetical protein